MRSFFVSIFIILSSFVNSTNLHASIPEETDKSKYIELGQIEDVGILFLDENDQLIGNRYYLDTGRVLLDPSGGSIISHWDGEKWVWIGGF